MSSVETVILSDDGGFTPVMDKTNLCCGICGSDVGKLYWVGATDRVVCTVKDCVDRYDRECDLS